MRRPGTRTENQIPFFKPLQGLRVIFEIIHLLLQIHQPLWLVILGVCMNNLDQGEKQTDYWHILLIFTPRLKHFHQSPAQWMKLGRATPRFCRTQTLKLIKGRVTRSSRNKTSNIGMQQPL